MSRGIRRRMAMAVLIPLAMVAALLAWAVASPVGSSPDDDYHLASIWCAGGLVEGRCEESTPESFRMLPTEVVEAACFAFDANESAACQTPVSGMERTSRGNWANGGYPPVYYGTMSLLVGSDVSASVVLMRSVNALLYVSIIAALFFVLPAAHRAPLLWGAAISAVPLGTFLIPSVNPSAWAVISATGVWVATWGYFRQTGPRKWILAGLVALLLVIGAGARSDAAVYGVLGLAAGSVLGFRPNKRFALDAALPVALTAVAVMFFFSGGQSAVVSGETAVPSTEYTFAELAFMNAKLLPQLWAGVFGLWGLGWLDTVLPGIVWASCLSAFVAVAFWGLRRGTALKWIALAGIATSLILVPMYILLHDAVVVGSYVQPRYIYPLIIVLGGIATVGFLRPNLSLGRLQLVLLAGALAVANSAALHVNLRRYLTGADVASFNLDRDIEWWWGPISPMTVWAGGSAAFALCLALLVVAIWPRNRVEPEIVRDDRPVPPAAASDDDAGSTSGELVVPHRQR